MPCCSVDCGAKRQQPYPMMYKSPEPAESRLNADSAYDYYVRLKEYWGVKSECEPPGTYKGQRALFHRPLPWWHQVAWMPKLKPGWRRPSYREFLEIYAIPVELVDFGGLQKTNQTDGI